jgi:hypothetical protein
MLLHMLHWHGRRSTLGMRACSDKRRTERAHVAAGTSRRVVVGAARRAGAVHGSAQHTVGETGSATLWQRRKNDCACLASSKEVGHERKEEVPATSRTRLK